MSQELLLAVFILEFHRPWLSSTNAESLCVKRREHLITRSQSPLRLLEWTTGTSHIMHVSWRTSACTSDDGGRQEGIGVCDHEASTPSHQNPGGIRSVHRLNFCTFNVYISNLSNARHICSPHCNALPFQAAICHTGMLDIRRCFRNS